MPLYPATAGQKRRRGVRRARLLGADPAGGVPLLEDLARSRLEWMALRRAKATVDFYGFAYRQLGVFVARTGAERRADRWTPELTDRYARWLGATGVQPATVRHYLDALLALLRWAVKQGKLSRDPLSGYEPPAGRPGEVPGYSVDEIDRMLAACPDDLLGRRDRAILTFGYDTGLRTSELAALLVGDVDLDRGMAQVRHGKGGKARVATFGPTAAAVVRRYLSQEHGNAANAAAPLFEGRPGRPLGRSGIYRLVRKRAVAAGVEGRKGLHRLRHSCAVQHLLHGGNARTVQEQLGHADMEMTRRYTAVLDVEDRRRQWRDTSPVEHTLKAPPVRVADEGNDTVPEAAPGSEGARTADDASRPPARHRGFRDDVGDAVGASR
jgi:integrase